MTEQAAQPGASGRWAHRAAVAAALAAVPLVLFGGSVTTLGAGMAVEGWLIAEGHFLLFFPVDEWFRDTATFVEHTHRLFGVLVGLCAVFCCALTWLGDRRARARWLATAALAAVVGQGVIGGLRVLEASPRLAFVHGALAQAVFALLCANALYASPRWRGAGRAGTSADERVPAGSARLAVATVLAVYAQVVIGAWYRHALRPTPEGHAPSLLVAHALGAVAVVVLVLLLARALRAAAQAHPRLVRPRRLLALLALQAALGLVAWLGYRPGVVGPLEWGISIAHVLVGGLLLAECTALAMVARKLQGGAATRADATAAGARWGTA